MEGVAMNKKWKILLLLVVFFIGSYYIYGNEETKSKKYIAIIIDDFGNEGKGTHQMLQLPIPITGAVIPGMPHATSDATLLKEANKEVIIHVPLEPVHGKASWLGSLGITTGLSDDQIKERLVTGYEQVPYAVGMNNHMGSRAMTQERIVKLLVDFAKEKGLYFVDSKTADNALSQRIASERQVSYLARDVFLDNQMSVAHVKAQLGLATKVAKEQGYAVVIGHVGEKGPYTAQGIREMIAPMQNEGIEFVTVSELMKILGKI